MGLPADPLRARGARHRGGAVHGLADPQERRHQPGAAPGWPGLGGVPAVPGTGVVALDFFTADLLNGTTVYVLAVIEHGTSRVRILGATERLVQWWVAQQARNLLWTWKRHFYNEHRPHCTLNQAAPLRPLPGGVTDLDRVRVLRRDRRFLPGVLATADRTTRVAAVTNPQWPASRINVGPRTARVMSGSSHDQSHWTREMV